MSKKPLDVATHRQQLLARIEAQRNQFERDASALHAPLALADKALSVARYLYHHPLLTIGSTLLLARKRPRGMGKWLKRGWMVWQVARGLRKSQAAPHAKT
jgi:hypothetical protein